jgi:cytochrome c-type biogenesis protein CcmH
VRVLWIVLCLAALSGWSYAQLGAAQTWWPLPLSQRVQITATTPEQLAEQTRAWQQATQSRPADAQAWLTLARLHAAQNQHALAEQALARVLVLAPENDLWVERAQMKALSAGGVFAGEPWQWIQQVLTAQPLHLNALVLAGSAAWSEKRHDAARAYWQQALGLVPADSDAAQGLQQALAQATEMAKLAEAQAP